MIGFSSLFFFFFFFNDTATTEIYTLSLHDALPISCPSACRLSPTPAGPAAVGAAPPRKRGRRARAEGRRSLVYAQLVLEKNPTLLSAPKSFGGCAMIAR